MTEAVSAVIVAAISAFVAAVVALAVNIQGHEQFFSTTVSTERMNWIRDMRGLCAELFSICEQYDSGSLPPEQYAAFLRARNGILIRVDPAGWYPQTDDKIIALLSDPDYTKVRDNIPEIRETVRRIFKSEWDKVKIEAGNSRQKVRKIEALQKKMDEEYRKSASSV